MTTNNHPAHGPVSLDRLHQIREILSKASAQSDGGNLGYAMADAVKVIDGAIAAFGAEPVEFLPDNLDRALTILGVALPVSKEEFNLDAERWMQRLINRVIRLESELIPPAPVVPDIDRLAIADKVYGKCCRIPGATFYNAAEFAIDEVEAYRSAMLHAGNSPATPDGWVPVSERMPEGSEEVLCTKEFDGPGDWRKKVGYWLAGKWTVYGASWTPTHWMPLPAAPQQEVKLALEHGMQRYAGAMQKLSEGDK